MAKTLSQPSNINEKVANINKISGNSANVLIPQKSINKTKVPSLVKH